MKKIFHLTNKYIILTTPLVLFALIGGLYFVLTLGNSKLIGGLISLGVLYVMTSAFIAGWGNMLKVVTTEPDSEEPHLLINKFIPGVGEYFLPSFGALTVVFIITFVLMFIASAVGYKFIGNPNIDLNQLSNSLSSTAALTAYLKTLTHAQLVKLELWNVLLLISISISQFLMLMYFPALFLSDKNPFFAFVKSLKNTFNKNFVKILGIYLTIFFFNTGITLASKMFETNMFASFVMTIINFYFVCFIFVWIFWFYSQNYTNKHLGQNVDEYI